jgi:hypothetical protein
MQTEKALKAEVFRKEHHTNNTGSNQKCMPPNSTLS